MTSHMLIYGYVTVTMNIVAYFPVMGNQWELMRRYGALKMP